MMIERDSEKIKKGGREEEWKMRRMEFRPGATARRDMSTMNSGELTWGSIHFLAPL